MKRILLAVGSLALAAMLGMSLVGTGVNAQDSATPAAGDAGTTDAQTTETGKTTREDYLAALAATLGITTEELQAAIDSTNTELGVEGRISIGGGFGGSSNSGMPGNGGQSGRGGSHGDSGRGGSNGDSGRGGSNGSSGGSNGGNGFGGGSMLRGVDTAAAATFLGITEDELATEAQESSFLEVALAHGKTTEEVRAFLIQQATEQIDERLQAASDAPAGEDATDTTADQGTTISEATEVPTAPAMTPTATA